MPAPATAAAPSVPEPRRDRKQDILLAAEKLFAQRGYHAVSLREIAEEAGVTLALVNYYFGQKHELFDAIFARWSGTIDERLVALRAASHDPADPASLRSIIEAFTGPVLRLRASSEGEFYALLVARELAHATQEADQVLRRHFDPMAHAFIDALNKVLPGASRGQIAWAYQFALGALLHHLSDHRVERLSRGQNRRGDTGAGPMLVAFISGGIRAALPASSTSRPASGPRSRPGSRPKPRPTTHPTTHPVTHPIAHPLPPVARKQRATSPATKRRVP